METTTHSRIVLAVSVLNILSLGCPPTPHSSRAPGSEPGVLVDLGGWILKGEDRRVLDLVCDISTESNRKLSAGEGNATKSQWLETGIEMGCELGVQGQGT